MAGLGIYHQLHYLDTLGNETFEDYDLNGKLQHMEGYGTALNIQSGEISRGLPESTPTVYRQRHSALLHNVGVSVTIMTWLNTLQLPYLGFYSHKICQGYRRCINMRPCVN